MLNNTRSGKWGSRWVMAVLVYQKKHPQKSFFTALWADAHRQAAQLRLFVPNGPLQTLEDVTLNPKFTMQNHVNGIKEKKKHNPDLTHCFQGWILWILPLKTAVWSLSCSQWFSFSSSSNPKWWSVVQFETVDVCTFVQLKVGVYLSGETGIFSEWSKNIGSKPLEPVQRCTRTWLWSRAVPNLNQVFFYS